MAQTQRVTKQEGPKVRSLNPARDRALEYMLVGSMHATEAIKRVTAEGFRGADQLNRVQMQMLAKRRGRERPSWDSARYVPWVITRKDQHGYYARALRAYGKMRDGGTVESAVSREMAEAMVRELKRLNKVLDYSPETGFTMVDRRFRTTECGIEVPIDEGWIRDPRLDDNGLVIE